VVGSITIKCIITIVMPIFCPTNLDSLYSKPGLYSVHLFDDSFCFTTCLFRFNLSFSVGLCSR
jgi:hypothetical protein